MKVIGKPVEMIASFDQEGKVRPNIFKFFEDDQEVRVVVDSMISFEKIGKRDNVEYHYVCESAINGYKKIGNYGRCNLCQHSHSDFLSEGFPLKINFY